MRIDDIFLKIILDSRGQETLQASMRSGNREAVSSVPQGKSKSRQEAAVLEARTAVRKFALIKDKIAGAEFIDLAEFDAYLAMLDNTPDKSRLGGNLLLVLSQVFCRLQAQEQNLELWQYLAAELEISEEATAPFFLLNLINGGKHAPYGPQPQEYLIIPQTANPQEAWDMAQTFFQKLQDKFQKKYVANQFGDEGGLLIPSDDYEEPLRLLKETRDNLGWQEKVRFALDMAASSFYRGAEKDYELEKGKFFSGAALAEIYERWADEYGICSIEDPFMEEDWAGFADLNKRLAGRTEIIGDDLTATNPKLVEKAAAARAVSGMIIKPTQIGSVSETLRAIKTARENNLKIIISHRSAETADHFIADLAWASRAWGLKAGAPMPEERVVKYKRMMAIYHQAEK